MAYAFIASASASAQKGATTAGINTTGADLIVVEVSQYPGGTGIATLTDSKGNTWTGLTAKVGTIPYLRLYYCQAPSVGSGHTFTFQYTLDPNQDMYCTVAAMAFSGSLSSPFDQENNAIATGTSLSTGSVTPTQDNELVVAALCNTDGSSGTAAITGGFTIRESINNVIGTNEGGHIAYLIQTTAAAANPSWSWTGSAEATAVIATFKAAPPPSAVREQEGFRFRDDDGSESAASWLDSQDTNITRAKSINTRLRTLVNVTNDPPSERLKLQYRKVGATGWEDVPV